MSTPQRSDYVIGDFDPADLAANYQCGHCNSDTEVGLDDFGGPRLVIHHDPGCPVLSGALSAMPDALRAATPDEEQLLGDGQGEQ
jgi:hypothetical protein